MQNEYPMTSVAPTVSAILEIPAPEQAEGPVIQDIVSDLSNCPRVAVLATDALGASAFERWRDEMPFLQSLHARRSLLIRSVMPTITPVNFATMVSGAPLSVHGVNVREADVQCETLFDVVRAHGGRSAGIGRTGYTGAELLARYADIEGRGAKEEKDVAVEALTVRIARKEVPAFLIVQLGITDDIFHQFGPSSPEVVLTLRETDDRVRRMVKALSEMGYGMIFLADHGQHDVQKEDKTGGTHGTDSDEDSLVPCTWLDRW